MKYMTVEIAFPDDALDVYDDKAQEGVIQGLTTMEAVTSARVVGVGEGPDEPEPAPAADADNPTEG